MPTVLNRFLANLAPLIALSVVLAGCSPTGEMPAPPPSEVGVITVTPQSQTLTSELPGRTRAWMVAEIRPQVGGIVQQRLFTEGAEVKAGDALYQLDPATYQAAYAEAKANAAKAEATLVSARLKAKRYAELAKIDAVSQQDNEDAQASLKTAEAELTSAQASVESARINLAYTRIDAPISGRIETSTVTPGALVTASQETALTTVQQIDPLYVDVTQSSAEVLRLKRELAEGKLKSAGKDEARITLLLEDGSAYPHEGRLQFAGATVSESTGSVTLRAVVPNPDGLLLPGMYVRAVLEEAVDDQALLVPQRAVTRSASGAASVLLVVDGKVEQRLVTLGRSVGNDWWVTSGLAAGDQLIVDGGQKARIGAPVRSVAFLQSAGSSDGLATRGAN